MNNDIVYLKPDKMKTLMLFAILFASVLCYAQTNLDQLKIKRDVFKNQIKSYNDSLKQIESKITEEENVQVVAVATHSSFPPVIAKVTNGYSSIFKEQNMVESLESPAYGTKVKIIGINPKNHAIIKVEYNGRTGFILDSDLEIPDEIKKIQAGIIAVENAEKRKKEESDRIAFDQEKNRLFRKAEAEKDSAALAWAKNKLEREAAQEKEYQDFKIEVNKKYGKTIAEKLILGQMWIGMTMEMAKYSLGPPSDVNKTIRANSISEQWVYRNKFLYFDNGILKTIQEHK